MERELRHPCVRELRNYISDKGNAEVRKTALDCVNEVLQWSTDYWELKNMTHLLLDLDTVVHVFDKESSGRAPPFFGSFRSSSCPCAKLHRSPKRHPSGLVN